jgi:hypothetical protein
MLTNPDTLPSISWKIYRVLTRITSLSILRGKIRVPKQFRMVSFSSQYAPSWMRTEPK